ncbi:iron transporter [Metapseudomonas otitidis]|uniref:Iron transporter n=1 Tax=Metapseudomonas otitidis TaxID=319939 RepID=A0ABU3XLU5_9GAMM|nr:iron transporter [Pseudomonas otitidis]MDH0335268.1 iron transporter [Pseudomonas otitidis]MDV3438922.1 iron transporter [Pseudomonas otitidis]MEE1892735.1 iron transporter [Pseudomonas otitidis]WMR31931.1 iron transporter [Pseudomonas otitidis]
MKPLTLLPLAALLALPFASAREYPIGEPQQCAGMEVGAVYLQPIEMDPPGMMRPAAESDVHMEADVRALESNRHGFQEGSFVPYLTVAYRLQRVGSDRVIEGDFHAMVASDGPHYGDNVKLDGPGQYQLTYRVAPPGSGHDHAFGRHTDKETGVPAWFEPCELTYRFTYAGIGKKGGY